MNRRELAELVITTVLEHSEIIGKTVMLDNRKQTIKDVENAIEKYEDEDLLEAEFDEWGNHSTAFFAVLCVVAFEFWGFGMGTTEYYRNKKGSAMDRAYFAFKKEDEPPKPKPVKLKPSEPIPKPILKQLLKVPHPKHSWLNRPLKKELAEELAELLGCSLDEFGGNWVVCPLPFLKVIVERLNVKLSQVKKWILLQKKALLWFLLL